MLVLSLSTAPRLSDFLALSLTFLWPLFPQFSAPPFFLPGCCLGAMHSGLRSSTAGRQGQWRPNLGQRVRRTCLSLLVAQPSQNAATSGTRHSPAWLVALSTPTRMLALRSGRRISEYTSSRAWARVCEIASDGRRRRRALARASGPGALNVGACRMSERYYVRHWAVRLHVPQLAAHRVATGRRATLRAHAEGTRPARLLHAAFHEQRSDSSATKSCHLVRTPRKKSPHPPHPCRVPRASPPRPATRRS